MTVFTKLLGRLAEERDDLHRALRHHTTQADIKRDKLNDIDTEIAALSEIEDRLDTRLTGTLK